VTAAAGQQHANPTAGGLQLPSVLDPSSQPLGGHGGLSLQEIRLNREQQQPFAPSWLTAQQQQQQQNLELARAGHSSTPVFASARLDQEYVGSSTPDSGSTQQAGLTFGFSPSSVAGGTGTASAPHMSATALLQKAAQMGATLSQPSNQGQMASTHSSSTATTNAASTTASPPAAAAATSNVTRTGLNFGVSHFGPDERSDREAGNMSGGNDGLTRDFLGLRAFSHGDILSIAGFDPCMSYEQGQHPSTKPWHA
jgi:hypothetical protein